MDQSHLPASVLPGAGANLGNQAWSQLSIRPWKSFASRAEVKAQPLAGGGVRLNTLQIAKCRMRV